MLRRIFKSKKEDGCNALLQSLDEKIKTGKDYNNIALEGLQELREIAWQKAMKYRFDPVLSRTHDEYLQALNGLIMECTA